MALKNTLLESAAVVAHETSRAYSRSLGDGTVPRWKDAPEWQKESCRHAVLFHCQHPEADAQAIHDNWYARRLSEGWSYGPTKDPENLRHPNMVPFKELPQEQQVKNHIFKCVVHGYLEARGHYVDGEVMVGAHE